MTTVESSSTWARPAGSPFGDASTPPPAADVATTQKGDAAIHCRCSGASRGWTLSTTRWIGYPMTARSSSSLAMTEVCVAGAEAVMSSRLGEAPPPVA